MISNYAEKKKRFKEEVFDRAVARPGGKHSMLDFDVFGASLLYFRVAGDRIAEFPFDDTVQTLKDATVEAWDWFQRTRPRYFRLMSEGKLAITLTHE